MRFDAVFFDSGGTLFMTPATMVGLPAPTLDEQRARRFARLAGALAQLGYPADEARLRDLLPDMEATGPRRFGPTYTYADLIGALAERLDLPLTDEQAALCVDAYVGPRHRCWLFPGTEQTLRGLIEAGVHVGMISNTYIPGRTVDRLLRDVGLLDYLATRVYSGDEGLAKPDPRIFHLAERRAGLAGRRLLYVGNKLDNDIKAAAAAGWATALKRSTFATSGGLADFEFDETPELLAFVRT